ncbi:phage holin family protein [Aurantimicrobium minutum]|uniref:phage holin family protein n=1 Tax=Aurantimicrobium minutum TaxID=708131 RepID=UPI0024760ECC|nr:phage holin family protein [Aurantimicrobium minutum]MDH6240175.1 putative membrane protein YqjE [Aurantimicrobium minutum]
MPASQPSNKETSEKSLFTLLRELPGILMDLLQAEFEQFKREMARKLKNLGVGAVLILIAVTLLSFLVFTLLLAGIFALALVMPPWAAALTVAGILVVIIAILVGAAAVQFKKGSPPLPTETFDSVVKDAHAIKGDDNNGV